MNPVTFMVGILPVSLNKATLLISWPEYYKGERSCRDVIIFSLYFLSIDA